MSNNPFLNNGLPPVMQVEEEPLGKNQIKVYVTMKNGDKFFGILFADPKERVQDVMNDERKFIPVLRYDTNRGRGNEDVRIMTVINKDSIDIIEER